MFQSFAGTERTLTDEFDVTVDYMDQAYITMMEKGPLKDVARQFMYFETGQGSEMTYRKHNGMDMTTCEALCYGLCRRYDPFMVNSATGFIGPETHLNDFELMVANLQDNFMGKLLGLPMGVSPSYTLHAETHLEGQQMTTHLAAAAGANFFMDIYLGTDRMLAHFVNSGHDDQTLREVHNRIPAPEFLEWAIEKGIFEQCLTAHVIRGPQWGNPRLFCPSETTFQRLRESLPSAPGFENAGTRPVNEVQRTLLPEPVCWEGSGAQSPGGESSQGYRVSCIGHNGSNPLGAFEIAAIGRPTVNRKSGKSQFRKQGYPDCHYRRPQC